MARKAENPDQTLIDLFLHMLAAERGGAQNTLAAYGRDLADLSAALGARGRNISRASTDDLRTYLGSLGSAASLPHRWRGGSRPYASFTASSTPRDTGRTTRPR